MGVLYYPYTAKSLMNILCRCLNDNLNSFHRISIFFSKCITWVEIWDGIENERCTLLDMCIRSGHVTWAFLYPPLQRSWKGGILVSPCPSVCPSVWHTCTSALSGWVLYRQLELTKLTCPDLQWCCGFVHTERRPSELGISMRAEGS